MKKFISWNVNGLRAILKKGFLDEIKAMDADAVALQETKMQEGQADVELEGYEKYWNYAERKGYSGTALFVKEKPLSVRYGIGVEEHDHEGRVITLEYPKYYLVTVYVPNSGDGLKRLDYRMTFEDAFLKYLKDLEKDKPVIYCGDLNVAHEEIDIKNPKANIHNAGFTPEERAKFDAVIGAGFIDTYRYLYPEKVEYSWWSYRFNARANNAGWRIDYFVVSDCLKNRIADAKIHTGIYGSDHCPVELDIEL
ncbi:MAG: exodeoxyribonuclease III [Erysipelotrichales bacterium]|nr:exodeoxyribonuclease III [Erysipelotrichales bacterium]MBQ2310669.1 exodeoxyribonuclease III [Erysipelotrichales bacterium]